MLSGYLSAFVRVWVGMAPGSGLAPGRREAVSVFVRVSLRWLSAFVRLCPGIGAAQERKKEPKKERARISRPLSLRRFSLPKSFPDLWGCRPTPR